MNVVSAPNSTHSWRVFVIDDSPDDRAEVRRLLLKGSDRRYKLDEADSGAEAIELILYDPDGYPDCIILDYHLPDMDAVEVLEALIGPDGLVVCPVVVLTGNVGHEHTRGVLRAGAQDYLGKSWMTPESLTRAIENAVERWTMSKELSERKEALRCSELRFRLAAAATHAMVYELDVQSMKVNSFHGLDHLVGYLETEALPTLEWWDERIEPEDLPKCRTAFERMHETGRGHRIQYRVRHKDGRMLWVEDNATPVHGDHGQIVGIVGTIVDITERKEAEDKLRQSYETFVQLVENNPFGMYVVDSEFRFRQASLGAQKIFSSVQPLIGRSFDEVLKVLWPPDFASEVSSRFRHTLATGEPYSAPSTIERRADVGEVQAYDWRIERVALPEGQFGVVCYFYDLSERRRWEAALLAKEQELQSLADSAPDVLTRFDRDLKHVFVNAAVEKATGRPRGEFLNKTNLELGMPSELCAQWDAALRAVFDSGEPKNLEFNFNTTGGARFHSARLVPEFGPDGSVQYVLGVTQDVTDRKETERKIRESEDTLRLALAASRAGVWSWEIKTGAVSWSPENFELYGYMEADGPPTFANWESRLHQDDKEHVNADIKKALQGEHQMFKSEFRVVHPSGETRWLLGLGKVEFDADTNPTRMSGINVDITDQKRIEEQLAIQDRRKDEFLATLAHELRNPLAPIRNGLEILSMSDVDEETVHEVRTMIQRQVRQMVHLVDDLLDVSRISQGKLVLRKERILLADVVKHAVETSRPLIEAGGHNLSLSIPQNPVLLDADETRLGQVISNLLNNAAKYSANGGHIELFATVEDTEIVVKVKDAGIGIPENMLPKIFDMFSQVEHSLEKCQGGLGIGLCLVRRLVELHGGRIDVTSKGDGQGSEFIVRLPKLSQQESRSLLQDEANTQVFKRWRMLIVDDNVDSAKSLAMMLRFQGHETRTAHDGLAAIALAEEFRPDIMLLDIGLPNSNGYEVCQRIRERTWSTGTTIVALTGWGQEEDRRRSKEAGFNHHWVKPIDQNNLGQLLTDLGDSSSMGGKTPRPSSLRVLVVDDMRDARHILSTLLKSSGYVVWTASDGQYAISMARDFHPDAILVDISMPGMSGLEVARQIRLEPKLKHTKLIALTGHGNAEDQLRSLEAGFDHHLVKPANIRLIRQLLEGNDRNH